MQSATVIVFSPFRLDQVNERLWCGEQPIHLRPKTFAVLRCLLAHPGQLLTKSFLLNTVWPEAVVSEAVLLGCIRDLRRALHDDPRRPQFIETVHRRGYRFIGSITATAGADEPRDVSLPHTRVPGSGAAGMPETMVGREMELTALHRYLNHVGEGARQVVFVTGEAGLGKTTLVEAFVAEAGRTGPLWIGRGQCVEHFGAGEAYMPVLEALGQLCRSLEGHALIDVLARYAPTWLVQMPWLLSEADLERLQRSLQGATRERMLREMAQALEALTIERPLVLVLEDLHWSDYATLNLLSVLARRQEPARLLLLGTYRPEEVRGQEHPLATVTQELLSHNACQVLPLTFLSEAAVAAYVTARLSGAPRLSELARYIHQRTDGNPLFMVNMVEDAVTQNVTDAGLVSSLQVRPEGESLGVPESLRQLLEQRFERLSVEEQQILETGGITGVEFASAVVASGLDTAVEQVESWCENLARRGRWLQTHGPRTWPDGTVSEAYGFVHALYQEVVYSRVPAARRLRLHRQIGEKLESMYGEQAQDFAAELAMHFEQGRVYDRAVQYRAYAAEQALRRYAYQEAIVHMFKGLDILPILANTPERLQQELHLQIMLAAALMATKGFAAPELEGVYTRTQELCHQVKETSQLVSVLTGLWVYYMGRSEYRATQEMSEQLLRLGRRENHPAALASGHATLGATWFWLGEMALGREHIEQGIALYDAQAAHFHIYAFPHEQDLKGFCLVYAAWSSWCLGYPDQALQQTQELLTLPEHQSRPYSLAAALTWTIRVHQCRRDTEAVQHVAEAIMALGAEHGFPYITAQGAIFQGFVLVGQGREAEGIVQIRQGIDAYRETGSKVRAYFLALLAEAYGEAGQAEAGLDVLAEALAHVAKTGEGQYEAELHRLRGELLLSLSVDYQTEAESCFQRALDITRCQRAKSLELRAATSLARLWQAQGKRQAAYNVLVPVYKWFTEGFDTRDLKDAKALLQKTAG
jgi:DNA-binding winged helix-turn-helix (wHTH) protein/predicted ATPase